MKWNGQVVGDVGQYMLFSHAKPPEQGFGSHCELEALPNCTQSDPRESKHILVYS